MARHPRRDVIAGLTVAVVALPLALAFGISSGRGAEAGIVTAIVAGILAALFGGSHLQVSGPTGAMTVVLVPIVAQFGVEAILVVGLLAGVFLIGLAYAGAGRAMRYVPVPVVEGFTIGIAIIIALQQVPSALGVAAQPGQRTVLLAAADAIGTWSAAPAWPSLLIAGGIAAAMLVAARLRPGLPVSLGSVVVATIVVGATGLPVATIGAIPAGLGLPAIPDTAGIDVSRLILPAVAVAALAGLESLLSATVADGMRIGERHDSDRELFGQGIANLVVPLFGGVPATAAIARTAVNVRSGARSRLAAITQSLALLGVVVVAAPWVGRIPLAALAGVLIATAIQMIEVSSLAAILRSTRGDAVVLVLVAVSTIALDLVTAVILGLVVAGAFALQQVASSARLDEIPLDAGDHDAEEAALLDAHIVAFRLDGPLFFGAAHAFLLELSEVSDVRVVVLRLSRLATIDATGATVLADTIARLEHRHVSVLLSGTRPEHAGILRRLGVFDRLADPAHVFPSTPEAIAHARVHAARFVHGQEAELTPS
ncbi:MAG: SulP family inorganic anion transporter [Chloroflexi bacterium]|nr:SulP family inorganic anion transporter [Chloroflexota bacterium]